jgi:hypothetical protein
MDASYLPFNSEGENKITFNIKKEKKELSPPNARNEVAEEVECHTSASNHSDHLQAEFTTK